MASPPPPPPALAIDGKVLSAVPFELSLFPTEIHVQADRQSGLFSGDFEIGVLVRPGPTQIRSAEITDLVQLYVTGDTQVQFFSQVPYKSLPGPFQVAITPLNWDLKTGYIYDLTCEIYITNYTSLDQMVGLSVTVTDLGQPDQVTAIPERLGVNVRSNTTEVALLALMVSASVASRSDIKVLVFAGSSELESHTIVNCDPNANVPEYYQITTPSTLSDITHGLSYNRQFTTAGGEEGSVTWSVNDPSFLADHGMRFTQSGVLKSDGDVLGSPEQQTLIFSARKETGLQTRMYATKIINLIIA